MALPGRKLATQATATALKLVTTVLADSHSILAERGRSSGAAQRFRMLQDEVCSAQKGIKAQKTGRGNQVACMHGHFLLVLDLVLHTTESC